MVIQVLGIEVERFWVQGSEVQGSGFKGSRFWVQRFRGSRFWVQRFRGSRFWVQRFKVLGSKVEGSGFKGSEVQGLGLCVQGCGFKVQRFKGSGSMCDPARLDQLFRNTTDFKPSGSRYILILCSAHPKTGKENSDLCYTYLPACRWLGRDLTLVNKYLC